MGFVLASLLAVAAAPESQPQVVWKWESDNFHCVLRQDLGGGRLLKVGGSPGSDQVGISIVDSAARIRSWKPLSAVEVTFAPGGTVKLDGSLAPHKNPDGRSIGIQFGAAGLIPFSGISALTLSHAEFGTLRLPVRSPAEAVQAIRACEDRRMNKWGVDSAAWRALPVKPKPKTSPAKWLTWLDYPDRQKIYANDIDVIARLDVRADGSVEQCTVVNNPPTEFIGAACEALRRNAKFQPARDALGKDAPAPYVILVRFGAYHL